MSPFRSIRPALALILGPVLGLGIAASATAQAFPRGLAGSYLAARQAGAAGDYQAAAEYFGRALSRDNRNPSLLENTMLAQIALGDIARAVPVARRMETAGLDSQIANMVILADQAASGDYDLILTDLEAGRSVGPLVDGLVKGWAELGRGNTDAAMAAFDDAAASTGLQAFALYHKALALGMIGDLEQSQSVFSGEDGTSLRLTRRGLFAQTQILSQLGRNADAVQLVDAAFGTDLDPGLRDLRAALEAGETLPFTMVRTPVDGMAEVFYTVAGALNGEANDRYTLLYSRTAQFLRSDHVEAILLSAGLLEAQGRFELATDAYALVPDDDPSVHAAEMGRANALFRSGREDEAVEVLQNLSESHPDLSIVWTTLGDTLRRMERYDEASQAYDAAVDLYVEDEPDQWVVYYARAITNERQKLWPQAEADFRKALELNPGQPQVLNYLGYSYLEMNTNLVEAMEMIKQAEAARPDSGHIVDSLGWGLYRLGRYAEAVGHMEKAAELLPVDPIVNDHLGDVYWAVGRHTEAQFQWHRALSFEPEEADAKRIRRKLEVGLDVVLQEEGAPPLKVAGDEP